MNLDFVVTNYIQELKDGVYETTHVSNCINPLFEVGKAAIIMPFIDVEGEPILPLDMLPSGITLDETRKEIDENDKDNRDRV